MQDPTAAGQNPPDAEPLDALLLALFARAPDADGAQALAAAGEAGTQGQDGARALATAEAFTRATMQRIHAEQRRHAWLRTGSTCVALAIAASAITAGGAFTPDAAMLPDLADAFTRVLATPSTWGATVVMLLALRSIAHALPGGGR